MRMSFNRQQSQTKLLEQQAAEDKQRADDEFTAERAILGVTAISAPVTTVSLLKQFMAHLYVTKKHKQEERDEECWHRRLMLDLELLPETPLVIVLPELKPVLH